MKRFFFLSTALLISGLQFLKADSSSPIIFTQGTLGTWNADWDGEDERTYFLQWSLDLKDWHFFPIIEYGTGAKSYGFSSSSEKFFVRLEQALGPSTDPEGADYDSDGISNIDEVSLYDTDPRNADTDADGLPDSWEIANGLDPRDDGSIGANNGALGDPDGDGVTNQYEYFYDGNPNAVDTDGDALSDYDELYVYHTELSFTDTDFDDIGDYDEIFVYGTNPGTWDTDEDTLGDGEELLVYSTNPLKIDSDGDWMWDDWEVDNGFDPADASDGLQDYDSDGLANQLEFVFMDKGFNPIVADTATFPWSEDPDYDGLTTYQEFNTYHTNPRQPDSDGDELDDGWEILSGFDPNVNNLLNANPDDDPNTDPDGDNLTNAQEAQLGTKPNNSDSDGDGVDDNVENNQGTNPNDPNDYLPPPGGTVTVNVEFGDQSGSHSEKYRLILTPLEGDTQGRLRTNRSYGGTQTDTFHLPKGAKYRIELKHAGTDPENRKVPRPDYDYILNFPNPQTSHLLIEDPDGILGNHQESVAPYAEDKNATLYIPLLEWITPKLSPVTAPDDITDGKNQYFYDDSNPGTFTMYLKMNVKPNGLAGLTGNDGTKFSDRCIFKVPTIAGSTLTWLTPDNAGGKSKTDGNNLIASATYTTLPASNSDFGFKQAELECDADANVVNKGDFEVFFTKDATNHPSGQAGSPNWFHYWQQFLPLGRIATLNYNNAIAPDYGQTVGQSRTTEVSQGASETNDETNNEGLHAFYETLVHESYHITLWEGWWGAGGFPVGSADTDHDSYPDSFETGSTGVAEGFSVSTTVDDSFAAGANTAGHKYEEKVCRQQEHNIANVHAYDTQDWSFDLTIHGKNQ